MHGSCLGNGQYDVDLESLRDGSRFAAHCMIATWWRTTTQEERHAPLAALDNILQASHQRCTSRSGSPAQSVSMQSMHFQTSTLRQPSVCNGHALQQERLRSLRPVLHQAGKRLCGDGPLQATPARA